jgi:hypothetical protein
VSLDVSNPSSPVQVSSTWVGGVQAFAVGGQMGYVGAYSWLSQPGLLVVDLSAPVIPVPLGSTPLPAYPRAVAVHEDRAFVVLRDPASGLYEVYVIDVSDPMAPAFETSVPLSDTLYYPYDGILHVHGDLLLASTPRVTRVFDLASPTGPLVEVDVIGRSSTAMTGYENRVAAIGTYGYGGSGGATLLDASLPTAVLPVDEMMLSVLGYLQAVDSGNSRLLVSTDDVGFEVFEPCGLIFAGDFEVGDTGRWDAVQ